MAIIGIIPARYASTRFPGKPLAIINGKSIIQRVFEQCKLAEILDKVIVATDDDRIFDHVMDFGGEAVMTSKEHQNGTSRCAEALSVYERNSGVVFNIIINIQGDEPFIRPEQIHQVADIVSQPEAQIGTLAKKIESEDELFNPNVVKLVADKENRALLFSRNPIPFVRDEDKTNWLSSAVYYKHIGLYGYRKDTLLEIAKQEPSRLELAEKLEQLRWMENGYNVSVAYTDYESMGVDTPGDLLKLTNKP
jgi:3-deoxy-manno-octulosonate cytidylyltransferase (CMP-KDO synthetase)